MDLQSMINNIVKTERKERFENLPQITLGELIDLLKDIPTEWGSDKQPVEVIFDFGTAYPVGISSWRGSYNELAINYSLSGYDGEQNAHTNLKDFVNMLNEAVGETYTGWKGGDFIMDRDTPLWVANDGNVGNTGVIGILNNDYKVVILTSYCEY